MEGMFRKTSKPFGKDSSYRRNTNLSKDIMGDWFANSEFGSIKQSPLKIRSIRVIISDKNIFSHGGVYVFRKDW
jgi:hypothetical protein